MSDIQPRRSLSRTFPLLFEKSAKWYPELRDIKKNLEKTRIQRVEKFENVPTQHEVD